MKIYNKTHRIYWNLDNNHNKITITESLTPTPARKANYRSKVLPCLQVDTNKKV